MNLPFTVFASETDPDVLRMVVEQQRRSLPARMAA